MANELTKKLSDFIRDLKTGVDEDLPLILGNRVVEQTNCFCDGGTKK